MGGNAFSPFNIHGIRNSHLMFADVVFVAFKANLKTCQSLELILDTYSKLTSLTINKDKSHPFLYHSSALVVKR